MSERSRHHHQVIDLANHVCATVSTRAQPGTCCDQSSTSRRTQTSTRINPCAAGDLLRQTLQLRSSSELFAYGQVSTRAQPGTCCDPIRDAIDFVHACVSTRAQPGTCCDDLAVKRLQP